MPPKGKVAKQGSSHPAPSRKKLQRRFEIDDDEDEEEEPPREVILKQEKYDAYDNDADADNDDDDDDDDDIFVKKRSRCATYEPYKVIVQNQRGAHNLNSINSHGSSQPFMGSSNSSEPIAAGKKCINVFIYFICLFLT